MLSHLILPLLLGQAVPVRAYVSPERSYHHEITLVSHTVSEDLEMVQVTTSLDYDIDLKTDRNKPAFVLNSYSVVGMTDAWTTKDEVPRLAQGPDAGPRIVLKAAAGQHIGVDPDIDGRLEKLDGFDGPIQQLAGWGIVVAGQNRTNTEQFYRDVLLPLPNTCAALSHVSGDFEKDVFGKPQKMVLDFGQEVTATAMVSYALSSSDVDRVTLDVKLANAEGSDSLLHIPDDTVKFPTHGFIVYGLNPNTPQWVRLELHFDKPGYGWFDLECKSTLVP
jgi:hypothetical protein